MFFASFFSSRGKINEGAWEIGKMIFEAKKFQFFFFNFEKCRNLLIKGKSVFLMYWYDWINVVINIWMHSCHYRLNKFIRQWWSLFDNEVETNVIECDYLHRLSKTNCVKLVIKRCLVSQYSRDKIYSLIRYFVFDRGLFTIYRVSCKLLV